MERIKLLLTLDIDPETGETTCVDREIINDDIKKTTKKTTKKVKKDEDTTPRIVLEDNKYRLNHAVVDLLGLDLEDENRLEIRYEKVGKSVNVVFGTGLAFGNENVGNKLTKSLTVACRGSANKELSEYGSEFTLEPHPSKEGLFILKGNKVLDELPDGDENVAEPEVDLSDFMEDDETEVDGFTLDLND